MPARHRALPPSRSHARTQPPSAAVPVHERVSGAGRGARRGRGRNRAQVPRTHRRSGPRARRASSPPREGPLGRLPRRSAREALRASGWPVLVSRVQEPQDRVPALRIAVFHRRHRQPRGAAVAAAPHTASGRPRSDVGARHAHPSSLFRMRTNRQNELGTLELIHTYVETLDSQFQNVVRPRRRRQLAAVRVLARTRHRLTVGHASGGVRGSGAAPRALCSASWTCVPTWLHADARTRTWVDHGRRGVRLCARRGRPGRRSCST